MKRILSTGAELRLTSCANLQVRPFHHTSAASSSLEKGGPSPEGTVNQAQTAPQASDRKYPQSSENKAEALTTAKKKTVAEMDEELRLKLEGMSGEGGSAGIEYENGKAEGLKRGVKSNMFRVI
ncbi:hypothetical protein UCDDA912_g04936 [Diaporthe ampelina]|uniref:Uncharacterized protein n=1 Tax=Diaporthe ampelina TaxID=1214573 RepID=A0A0G2HJ39_9PEZI|nr:hypothetical protein UCDDA912_g04936 [Diaporthe ampelina]